MVISYISTNKTMMLVLFPVAVNNIVTQSENNFSYI